MIGDAVLSSMGPSRCAICGHGDQEDQILLCDGHKCQNEIHMTCLNPPLEEVPEGDWFCPECQNENTVRDQLLDYLEETHQQRLEYCAQYNTNTSAWLSHRIQYSLPLQHWCDGVETLPSEYNEIARSTDIIGKSLWLYIQGREYTGRILHYRYHDSDATWEHLIQFKSGSGDLNKPLLVWVQLDDHSCIIGGELAWVKPIGLGWKPAQICFRSAIYLAETGVFSKRQFSYLRVLEENTFLSNVHERLLLPFTGEGAHVKEFRTSKKTNLSYALAVVELEEQEAVRRAYNLLTMEQLQHFGAVGDGFRVKHLRLQAVEAAQCSLPSVYMGQYEIKVAYNASSLSHDVSARLRGGRILALDGLYMASENMLEGKLSPVEEDQQVGQEDEAEGEDQAQGESLPVVSEEVQDVPVGGGAPDEHTSYDFDDIYGQPLLDAEEDMDTGDFDASIFNEETHEAVDKPQRLHAKILFATMDTTSSYGCLNAARESRGQSSSEGLKHDLELMSLTPFRLFDTLSQMQEEIEAKAREEEALARKAKRLAKVKPRPVQKEESADEAEDAPARGSRFMPDSLDMDNILHGSRRGRRSRAKRVDYTDSFPEAVDDNLVPDQTPVDVEPVAEEVGVTVLTEALESVQPPVEAVEAPSPDVVIVEDVVESVSESESEDEPEPIVKKKTHSATPVSSVAAVPSADDTPLQTDPNRIRKKKRVVEEAAEPVVAAVDVCAHQQRPAAIETKPSPIKPGVKTQGNFNKYAPKADGGGEAAPKSFWREDPVNNDEIRVFRPRERSGPSSLPVERGRREQWESYSHDRRARSPSYEWEDGSGDRRRSSSSSREQQWREGARVGGWGDAPVYDDRGFYNRDDERDYRVDYRDREYPDLPPRRTSSSPSFDRDLYPTRRDYPYPERDTLKRRGPYDEGYGADQDDSRMRLKAAKPISDAHRSTPKVAVKVAAAPALPGDLNMKIDDLFNDLLGTSTSASSANKPAAVPKDPRVNAAAAVKKDVPATAPRIMFRPVPSAVGASAVDRKKYLALGLGGALADLANALRTTEPTRAMIACYPRLLQQRLNVFCEVRSKQELVVLPCIQLLIRQPDAFLLIICKTDEFVKHFLTEFNKYFKYIWGLTMRAVAIDSSLESMLLSPRFPNIGVATLADAAKLTNVQKSPAWRKVSLLVDTVFDITCVDASKESSFRALHDKLQHPDMQVMLLCSLSNERVLEASKKYIREGFSFIVETKPQVPRTSHSAIVPQTEVRPVEASVPVVEPEVKPLGKRRFTDAIPSTPVVGPAVQTAVQAQEQPSPAAPVATSVTVKVETGLQPYRVIFRLLPRSRIVIDTKKYIALGLDKHLVDVAAVYLTQDPSAAMIACYPMIQQKKHVLCELRSKFQMITLPCLQRLLRDPLAFIVVICRDLQDAANVMSEFSKYLKYVGSVVVQKAEGTRTLEAMLLGQGPDIAIVTVQDASKLTKVPKSPAWRKVSLLIDVGFDLTIAHPGGPSSFRALHGQLQHPDMQLILLCSLCDDRVLEASKEYIREGFSFIVESMPQAPLSSQTDLQLMGGSSKPLQPDEMMLGKRRFTDSAVPVQKIHDIAQSAQNQGRPGHHHLSQAELNAIARETEGAAMKRGRNLYIEDSNIAYGGGYSHTPIQPQHELRVDTTQPQVHFIPQSQYDDPGYHQPEAQFLPMDYNNASFEQRQPQSYPPDNAFIDAPYYGNPSLDANCHYQEAYEQPLVIPTASEHFVQDLPFHLFQNETYQQREQQQQYQGNAHFGQPYPPQPQHAYHQGYEQQQHGYEPQPHGHPAQLDGYDEHQRAYDAQQQGFYPQDGSVLPYPSASYRQVQDQVLHPDVEFGAVPAVMIDTSHRGVSAYSFDDSMGARNVAMYEPESYAPASQAAPVPQEWFTVTVGNRVQECNVNLKSGFKGNVERSRNIMIVFNGRAVSYSATTTPCARASCQHVPRCFSNQCKNCRKYGHKDEQCLQLVTERVMPRQIQQWYTICIGGRTVECNVELQAGIQGDVERSHNIMIGVDGKSVAYVATTAACANCLHNPRCYPRKCANCKKYGHRDYQCLQDLSKPTAQSWFTLMFGDRVVVCNQDVGEGLKGDVQTVRRLMTRGEKVNYSYTATTVPCLECTHRPKCYAHRCKICNKHGHADESCMQLIAPVTAALQRDEPQRWYTIQIDDRVILCNQDVEDGLRGDIPHTHKVLTRIDRVPRSYTATHAKCLNCTHKPKCYGHQCLHCNKYGHADECCMQLLGPIKKKNPSVSEGIAAEDNWYTCTFDDRLIVCNFDLRDGLKGDIHHNQKMMILVDDAPVSYTSNFKPCSTCRHNPKCSIAKCNRCKKFGHTAMHCLQKLGASEKPLDFVSAPAQVPGRQIFSLLGAKAALSSHQRKK